MAALWGRVVYLLFIFNVSLVYTQQTQSEVVAAEIEYIGLFSETITRDPTGALVLPARTQNKLVLVGSNITTKTSIAFTTGPAERGFSCEHSGGVSKGFAVELEELNSTRGFLTVNIDKPTKEGVNQYLCVKEAKYVDGDTEPIVTWIHQGSDTYVRFTVVEPKTTLLPIGIQITIICILLMLSGLFSGLNLGLMSLDKTELKIIERCGSPKEKEYARVISPLRKRGNFLLCTLLLGNVLVNNSLTIMLDDISNGLVAIIASTAFIVVFGEIVPQAICSRHGLAVGAHTRMITYTFMALTFILSYPISLILDKILGEEIGQVYNREKLQELIRVTKDFSALDDDEVNIISGALTLTKKTVRDIMTRIEDVFMLDYNECVLNFETMSNIMKHGYTRIPVYDGDKSNIVALLNIKDLALIDPDDNTPLKTVCKFYQHHLIFVFDDQRLDKMLQDFRQGHSHMAIVRRVNNEGDGDPYYETLGVVTLEDVIEEIIQSEIIDETDTLSDNIKKAPRTLPRQDFSTFYQQDDNRHVLSPQLTMAAFQFLSTSVDPFLDKFISENVLKKLIHQNVAVEIHPDGAKDQYLYEMGVPCDYFVLVLEGHVSVYIGKEELLFHGGPFSYYGSKALSVSEQILAPTSTSDSIYIKSEPYIPDFTVKATENLVFLRIKRAHYIVARRATLMSRSKIDNIREDDAFNSEWKHFSKVNDKCNNAKNALKDGGGETSVQVFTENWAKLQNGTSVDGLQKRSDSKDSGWNFPSDEKLNVSGQADQSGAVGSSVDLEASKDQPQRVDGFEKVVPKVGDSGHRTREKVGGASADKKAGKHTCDGGDGHDDEQISSGEFTPLVDKKKRKQPAPEV